MCVFMCLLMCEQHTRLQGVPWGLHVSVMLWDVLALQWGEDGILESVFMCIGTTNKQFAEFGAEGGVEVSTRWLREGHGFKGGRERKDKPYGHACMHTPAYAVQGWDFQTCPWLAYGCMHKVNTQVGVPTSACLTSKEVCTCATIGGIRLYAWLLAHAFPCRCFARRWS